MADDNTISSSSDRSQGPGRGYRQGGQRDSGGLRIRLSDNEMRAARAVQEAFGLRSTVAVLGFSLRTLAQQLEQGQLDELVRQHRAQAGARPQGGRGADRRRERGEGSGTPGQRGPRTDPLARPSKPVAAPPPEPEPEPQPAPEGSDGTIVSSEPSATTVDSLVDPSEPSALTAESAEAIPPDDEDKPPATAATGSTATGTESGA